MLCKHFGIWMRVNCKHVLAGKMGKDRKIGEGTITMHSFDHFFDLAVTASLLRLHYC